MQAKDSALESSASPGFLGFARACVELMKPRIIMLLLVTTLATMIVAGSSVPPWRLIFFTLLGGILTSGSANAINMVYDRDIDSIMSRTRWRPLPTGRLTPGVALGFAIFIGLLGVAELAYFVNPLAALLALAGNLFYVFVYTMWLKRSTAQNIVIGGAAGAVPPLVGWAAVRGNLDWAALILFGIIFLWTPPHFWALALYKNDDYRAANVPMMPVVHGKVHTMRQMLAYCAILIPVSLLLMAVHPMTVFYFVAALALGALFGYHGLKVARERTDVAARRMFGVSILYLGAIFGAMVLDQLVAADYLPPVLAGKGVNGYAVDVSRNVDVTFQGEASPELKWTVEPSIRALTMHPNEQRQLVYRVTNHGDKAVTAMAEHDFNPPNAGGFYKKVQCFCFSQQTVQPGQTVELPLVFSFVDALPADIRSVTVRYTFKPVAAEAAAGHDHGDHDH